MQLNIINYKIRSNSRKTCYTLWIENNQIVKQTLLYLYNDSNYYLKRKVQKIINYYKAISSEAMDTFIERSTTT